MKNLTAAVILSILISGCANRPSSIRASYVSHEKFTELNCGELLELKYERSIKLERLSREQDGKATGDAIGVFLLGIPFSKLSGDHEGDIAHLKGEVEAIETAQIKAKCKRGGDTISIPTLSSQNQKMENRTSASSASSNPYARCVSQLNSSLGGCDEGVK